MARLLALILCLAAAPPAAQEPVSPEEFEAMAEGRTLHFTHRGAPYGAEQFFAGRRSLWRFVDGECAHGTWRSADGMICFAYDGAFFPQCWRLSREGGELRAVLVDRGVEGGPVLDLARIDDVPLDCPGPRVGS